jgi:predicted dehydrogenase
MSTAEVEAMVQAARDNNRLLVEAISFRWHPRMIRLVDYVQSGNIGKLISIDSSFTFPANIEGNYRNSPAMGGGALFDVGVYPLHAFSALVGDQATAVVESCEKENGPTGIDLTSKWRIHIGEAVTANGLASFAMPEDQGFIVQGEKQAAEIIGNQAFTSWHSPSSLRLGDLIENFDAVDPYMLMIENFGNRINGEDSWVLPIETSLSVARMLDQLHSA